MPEWIGKTIGKVRVDDYLARGGMAEVYLGTHLSLDRQVALKVLHSFIESDPELLLRFQREAKAVAGLRHPNIVQVFDFDAYEDHPYIVMEYLKGPSFASYLTHLHGGEKKLSLEQIGQLLRPLSSALDYAHSKGVIHRDIKPANIILHRKNGEFLEDDLLTSDVEPVVTDFGLARIISSGKQTATGLVSGTPSYMSPEQARGANVDHRTDIYSFGIILYEMIAGRVPFDGDSAISVIYKHINEAPPPIENISPKLQAVIDKALAKNPDDRYHNCYDLVIEYNHAIGLQNATETTRTLLTAKSPASQPVGSAGKNKPSRALIWVGAALLTCFCISLVISSGVLGISAFTTLSKQTETSGTEGADPGFTGLSPAILRFQDGASTLDQVTISGALSTPAQNTQYEAWLIGDNTETIKSLGVLAEDTPGQFLLSFIDPQSRNLLRDYNRMEITIESNPDSSPNPSGHVAYSSEIPAGSLEHIRHLIVMYDTTPDQKGMAVGLVTTCELIKESTDEMADAYTSGDIKKMRSNAEAVINLIAGSQDLNLHKDWDEDGKTNDPGDGFGLLLNGDQDGYIGGAINHAKLSAAASDSTPEIRMHSEHVVVSSQNVEFWATQLRDIAIKILGTPANQVVEGEIHSATSLANQILNGIDINGNESVDPIPGEGGAITAYEHAEYMADMPILPGENQVPTSGQ